MEEKIKQERTLPKGFTLKWSTQLISHTISFVVLGYLAYYCTNSLGLNAGVVGVILLISKLLDGITDLVAAVVIERTRTRWGKARPYILLMDVAWILIIAMFSTPDMPVAMQALYIFVCYFIINSVCITLAYGAEPVYLARALPNVEDASTVLSYSGLLSVLVSILISVAFPIMITTFGTKQNGWTIITLIIGIPCIILSTLRFFLIKERPNLSGMNDANREKPNKFGFKDMVRVLMGNPHVFVIVLIQLVINVFTGLGAAGTYYFQYIMGDINLQSLATLASMVGIIATAFVPILMKKFYPIKVIALATLLGVIGCLLRIFPIVPILLLGNALTGMATTPIGVIIPSLAIDCMDYNEWKTGERVEAVFSSANAFATKLGSGIASILTGAVMALTGYNGLAETQTPLAIKGIIALYAVIPAIMFAIVLFTTKFYNIDKDMKKARAELAEKGETTKC